MYGSVARKGGPRMYRFLERVVSPILKWRKKTWILVVKRRF